MSFRVKKTHKFLQENTITTNGFQKKNVNNLSSISLLDNDSKSTMSFLDNSFVNLPVNVPEKPKVGMAIRLSPGAMADHM
jgi:hypothetical protein